MAKKASSLRRGKPSKKVQPKILIVCEDSKSSLNYLTDASNHYRVSDNLHIMHCGNTDPDGIVSHGVSKKSGYDKVYCVIDRDTHHNFAQAVDRANSHNISLIVSYPCFEYWLYLHFHYSRKPYEVEGNKSPADVMIRDLKAVDGIMSDYDKGSDKKYFKLLLDRLENAITNGQRSTQDSQTDNEPNPSTRIQDLIMSFKPNK